VSRFDEIKARADAATEGPWVRDMHSPDMSGRSGWYIRGPRKLGLRSMVLTRWVTEVRLRAGNPDRAASLSLLITPAHPMTLTREGDPS